jgi:hypothetical protein
MLETQTWFQNGQLHRTDGPAFVQNITNLKEDFEPPYHDFKWYLKGEEISEQAIKHVLNIGPRDDVYSQLDTSDDNLRLIIDEFTEDQQMALALFKGS